MEEQQQSTSKFHFLHKLSPQSPLKMMGIILGITLLAGIGSGFALASSSTKNSRIPLPLVEQPKTAQQDTKTFRDFAEGKITKKPEPKKGGDYGEGTHMLIRDGAMPVALTSSVVDLSLYENKKVKVYGETQKAIKEGWLMDVGKVEEVK